MTARQSCGSIGAYSRHLRNDEKPCPACYAAHAAYQRDHNARRTRQRQIERDIREVVHVLATAMGVGRQP